MSTLLWWAVSLCSLAAIRKLIDAFGAIAFEIREAELDRHTTAILSRDSKAGGQPRAAERK